MSRRGPALLAALALSCVLLTPFSRAASSPVLAWEDGEDQGEILLALQDLDGSGVYAVQLELELAGRWPEADFTPAGRDFYSVCQAVEEGDSTRLTVYLSSRSEPLGSAERLFLGYLDLGGRGDGEEVLPSEAVLTLLGRGLNRMEELSGSAGVRERSGISGWDGGDRDEPPRPSRPARPEPEPEPEEVPAEPVPPAVLPFADVRESDWYCAAVRYVFEQGLMNGTTADRFGPDEPATRGMIVTILHRMEGSPAAPDPTFPDVRADFYYAQPITWAEAQGIVTGYEDGTFGPEDSITREQLAAILFRFAGYKGWALAAPASLERFPDAGRISPYAAEPLSWAVGAGLVSGMANGMLSPGGTATRAEVATILMRLDALAGREP